MKLKRNFSLRLLLGVITVAALVAFAWSPTSFTVRIRNTDIIGGLLVPGDRIDIVRVAPDGASSKTVIKSARVGEIDTNDDVASVAIRVFNYQKWWLTDDSDYRIALLADPN